jgi:hypothetical protein
MLLASCAITGTQIQSECESKYSGFVEAFNCTRDRIRAESPKRLDPPQAKLYMLKGEQLSERVKAGQMSDIDAKVEWAKAYMEMQQVFDAESARNAAALVAMSKAQRDAAALSPPPLPVSPPLTTNCLTSPALGGLQTSCTTR